MNSIPTESVKIKGNIMRVALEFVAMKPFASRLSIRITAYVHVSAVPQRASDKRIRITHILLTPSSSYDL